MNKAELEAKVAELQKENDLLRSADAVKDLTSKVVDLQDKLDAALADVGRLDSLSTDLANDLELSEKELKTARNNISSLNDLVNSLNDKMREKRPSGRQDLDGFEFEMTERMIDLVDMWRKRYVPDDALVAVLRKKV